MRILGAQGLLPSGSWQSVTGVRSGTQMPGIEGKLCLKRQQGDVGLQSWQKCTEFA